MFFVALGGQRRKGVFSARKIACVVEHGRGDGLDRRGLEEVAVETAENPVETGNFDGGADAGIDGGFVESGVVDGEALAAEQGDVAAEAQVVGEVELDERCAGVAIAYSAARARSRR